eukprot:s2871_g3.t2
MGFAPDRSPASNDFLSQCSPVEDCYEVKTTITGDSKPMEASSSTETLKLEPSARGLGEAGARGSEVEAALQLRASVRCGWGCAEDAADPQSELSVAAKGVDRSPAACEVAMKAAGGFMTGLSAGL